jgi:Arc/MetJ-type ribon-helix-helix transcriptional regulator
MRTERVEVRLDPEMRGKLKEVAARGSSISELVRDLIQRSHEEEVAGAARLAAAERIGQMEVQDVPEPAELKRQLSEL